MFPSEARAHSRTHGTLVSQVLGLLAFSTFFTAGGAALAPVFGGLALTVGLAGGLVTLLVLVYRRGFATAYRLGLFYLFSTFEGLALGVIVNMYVAAGLGNIVVLAAGITTGLIVTLLAYSWTTKRTLAGLGNYLFVGLIGLLTASVTGLFVSVPVFHLVVAGVSAILFCGYLLYDVQQLKLADADVDPVSLAIEIYLDVLNLCLDLLRILSYFIDDE